MQDRKLRCDLCKKFKTSYTLDYARHRDAHKLANLGCVKCSIPIDTPAQYAEHLELHHSGSIMSTEVASHVEPSVPSSAVDATSSGSAVNSGNSGGPCGNAHEEDVDNVIEANLGSALEDEKMLESFFQVWTPTHFSVAFLSVKKTYQLMCPDLCSLDDGF